MQEAHSEDIEEILCYLRPHVEDCIYMYIDIKKYGLDNSNMKVWLGKDQNGVNLVVMKYHTSISLYTRVKEWDVKAVEEIIRSENPLSITSTKEIIEILMEKFNEEYDVSYGSVFEYTNFRPIEFNGEIELADEKDCREIAKLIMIDEDIGGYYEVEDLANQFVERMRTNMGRSYVIRDNGKIIAHIASYAECDHIATTSGQIVDPDYRNGFYGTAVEGYLVERLKEENYKVYTFVTSRMRRLFLAAQGNPCVGEYGKMTLRSNPA